MKKLIAVAVVAILIMTGCETKMTIKQIEIPMVEGVEAKLEPSFSPSIYEYTLDVPNDVSLIEVITKANDDADEIYINGVLKGTESPFDQLLQEDATGLMLQEGLNEIVIKVKNSEDEVDYKVTINREDLSEVRAKFLNLSYTSEELGITLPYRLYVPENYDEQANYPLVFFLHGAGERGVDNELPLSANLGGVVFATDEVQASNETFVLVPQARDGDLTTGFGLTRGENGIDLKNAYQLSDDTKVAKEILSQIIDEYSIDEAKIYATGISQGAFGIWALNLEYPNLFAKMVPVAGGGDANSGNLVQLKDKPIWQFHAQSDPVIPISQATEINNKLTELGANPKLTIYDEESYIFPMAHASWIPAYHNQEMLKWLFE